MDQSLEPSSVWQVSTTVSDTRVWMMAQPPTGQPMDCSCTHKTHTRREKKHASCCSFVYLPTYLPACFYCVLLSSSDDLAGHLTLPTGLSVWRYFFTEARRLICVASCEGPSLLSVFGRWTMWNSASIYFARNTIDVSQEFRLSSRQPSPVSSLSRGDAIRDSPMRSVCLS